MATASWSACAGAWCRSSGRKPQAGAATFNARAETVADKPMFKEAFKRRRCIVPASGFYEWTGEEGDKTPHLHCGRWLAGFAMAGLWERWRNPASGEDVLSCTIVVSGASDWMRSYHDRMPVLLAGGDIDAWLTGTMGQEGLKPASENALWKWPVMKRLNKAGQGDDDPTMVDRAA